MGKNCTPPAFRDIFFPVNQRLIAEIGKSQRLRVVNRLKRTQGLSVGELAEALGMSYMGVKQHCIELERLGYLDTWRRPKAAAQVGRPELVYRLTRKALELFPSACNETTLMLLDAAQSLYGTVAPEKLLFLVFQRKTEGYVGRVKGATVAERATAFAAIRDAEGCMAELERDGAALRVVEHHSPLADLLAAYPALLPRLEQEMYSRVLRTPVKREQTEVSGLYCCVFRIG
jgi:predicted ArsR family transcriptional regulator